jgi:hypothetical protein
LAVLKVRLLREDEELPARALEVRAAGRVVPTPSHAVDPALVDGQVLGWSDLRGFVEIAVRFTPGRLDRLHRSLEYSEGHRYSINSRVGRVPRNQVVVAVPLLEAEKGRVIAPREAKEYGAHMAELVANPHVDLACTPVFRRVPEGLYEAVLRGFLEAMESYDVGVALSIPYASRKTRHQLIELYHSMIEHNSRGLLNFLCVDYHGSNPVTKYDLHNYVLSYTRLVEEETGEPVLIYGLNVRYNRVARKYERLSARDLASYFGRLDVYGQNHWRMQMPSEVAKRAQAEPPEQRLKLLDRGSYLYLSLSLLDELRGGEEVELARSLLEGQRGHQLEKTVRRLNTLAILREVDVLRPLFQGRGWQSHSTPLDYLQAKEAARIDNKIIQTIKSYNRALAARQRTLDDYK